MSGTKDHMSSSVEYYQRRQRIGKQVDLNGQVILDNSQTPATPKATQQSKDVSVRAWATPQASDHVEGASHSASITPISPSTQLYFASRGVGPKIATNILKKGMLAFPHGISV